MKIKHKFTQKVKIRTSITTRMPTFTIQPKTFAQSTDTCPNPQCRAGINTTVDSATTDAPYACTTCGTPYQSDRGDAQM